MFPSRGDCVKTDAQRLVTVIYLYQHCTDCVITNNILGEISSSEEISGSRSCPGTIDEGRK